MGKHEKESKDEALEHSSSISEDSFCSDSSFSLDSELSFVSETDQWETPKETSSSKPDKMDMRNTQSLINTLKKKYLTPFERYEMNKKDIQEDHSRPPMDFPTTEAYRMQKTFSWPLHVRNLIHSSSHYLQDPSSIHLTTSSTQSNFRSRKRKRIPAEFTLPIAALPRPVSELVEERARESLQDNEIDQMTEEEQQKLNYQLIHLARQGDIFIDQLLHVALTDTAAALQGKLSVKDPQGWECIGNAKRPTGNWRFIKERLIDPLKKIRTVNNRFLPLSDDTLRRVYQRMEKVFPAASKRPKQQNARST